MRRWLGIGAVLAALLAVLGYVLGPKWTDLVSGAAGRDARTWEDATPRPPPVSALLGAPLPPARGNLFIRGTVLGRDGRPVAGAVVVATAPVPGETLSELPAPCKYTHKKLPQCDCDKGLHQLVEKVAERQGEAPPHARTTSDEEGRFSLDGLKAGTYALWADGPFGTLLHLDVPAGSESLELRVGPGMTLSGHLRDEDGNPAAGALVTALLVEHSRFFDTLADDRGNWRLGPLPMGSYHLVVTLAGFLPEHTGVPENSTPEELEMTLYRPLRLTGQVLREGQPVAEARVHVQGKKHERDIASDAQGRFSLEDLWPNNYQLIATHAGLDAVRKISLEPGMDTQNVLLELGTDARVTGTVRDLDGNPIPYARVMTELSQKHFLKRRVYTWAASDGTYSLGPIPLGRYQLSVETREHATSSAIVNVPAGGLHAQDFTLGPAIFVEGRVLDTEGQPIPDIELELEDGKGEETSGALRSWGSATSSGEDGTFVLKALEPIGHRLRAHHEDFIPTVQSVLPPASGVQVVLRTGARVEGEVVDEKGVPVPQAQVQLDPVEDSSGEHLPGPKEARTDERGRCTFRGLAPGKYQVSVWSGKGDDARALTRSIEVSGAETVRVRLPFPVGLSLSGLVVDEAGKPVPEATLHLSTEKLDEPEQEIDLLESQGQPRTGADGRFQFRHLSAGSYRLNASARGHDFNLAMNGLGDTEYENGDEGIQVRAGDADVRIVLEKLARIRGRVVRPDGTPVTRFYIDSDEVVDPHGAFELPITESKEETRVFSATDLGFATRKLILRKGVDAELGEVVLAPGQEVRGRVVDGVTGAPVAGAEVHTAASPSSLEWHFQKLMGKTRTASDGTFTLTHREEDEYFLGVEHPDYQRAMVAIAPQQAEVTVSLATGTTLKGKVHLLNRRRFEVVVRPVGGEWRRARVVGTEYELRSLSAGPHDVFVQTSDFFRDYPTPDIPARQVDIPANGVVMLDINETPAGTMLRLHLTGVSRWEAFLVAGSHPSPNSTRERYQPLELGMKCTSWEAVIPRLPRGHYTLFVTARIEDELLLHREELELPGKGVVSHDISPQWVRVPDSTLRALDD